MAFTEYLNFNKITIHLKGTYIYFWLKISSEFDKNKKAVLAVEY